MTDFPDYIRQRAMRTNSRHGSLDRKPRLAIFARRHRVATVLMWLCIMAFCGTVWGVLIAWVMSR